MIHALDESDESDVQLFGELEKAVKDADGPPDRDNFPELFPGIFTLATETKTRLVDVGIGTEDDYYSMEMAAIDYERKRLARERKLIEEQKIMLENERIRIEEDKMIISNKLQGSEIAILREQIEQLKAELEEARRSKLEEARGEEPRIYVDLEHPDLHPSYELDFSFRPGDPISEKKLRNGRTFIQFENDVTGLKYRSGTLEVKVDDRTYRFFANGDISIELPDGARGYLYSGKETVELSLPDGDMYIAFSNGQREIHHLDGSVEVSRPGKSFRRI